MKKTKKIIDPDSRTIEYRPILSIRDRNVANVLRKLLERSKVGIKKYGTTTCKTRANWLLHLQEELMDACVYIEAQLNKEKGKK